MTDSGWAIGLMSGTSLDGIDAALLRTDGVDVVEAGPGLTQPYGAEFREQLRACFGKREAPAKVVSSLTEYHAQAVQAVLDRAGMTADMIEVIGFHGQTIHHDAGAGITVQIGDGALLASLTDIPVVAQMRLADMAAGGQGAPLAPAFHAAMAGPYRDRPCGFLNIGGVANITYLAPAAGDDVPEPIAFDTGPGNALIDDWAASHTGQAYDRNGFLAAAGAVDEAVLKQLMDNPYFSKPYPKSADRDDFNRAVLTGLSPVDGAATLTRFTIESIAAGIEQLPEQPPCWWATGGGRHNPQLMAGLRARLAPVQVEPVELIGWAGDMVEAWAFAYLAKRALKGLPLSFPGTTGVAEAISGGELHHAPGRAA